MSKPMLEPDGFNATILDDTCLRVHEGRKEAYRLAMLEPVNTDGLKVVVNPERLDRCRIASRRATPFTLEESPDGPTILGIPIVADAGLAFGEIRFRIEAGL